MAGRPRSDLSGGHTSENGIFRDILCHHGARRDDSALPNVDALQNCDITADPDIVRDDHLRMSQSLLVNRNREVIISMIRRDDRGAVPDADVVAYCQSAEP